MSGFRGFPAGKQPSTPLPDLFFGELLPAIDHLGELKVTLHLFWLLARKKGERPCADEDELAADPRLLRGLAAPGPGTAEGRQSPRDALADALGRAVRRGTFLRVVAGEGPDRRAWYFVNSDKGRRAVEDLLAGTWTPEPGRTLLLDAGRSNIFVLYEQNVGPLTPLLADELMEAERTYPAAWIEDAFREAVTANVRSWRYIRAILERWAAEGRNDETSRRDDDRGRRRFIEGDYADYIEH